MHAPPAFPPLPRGVSVRRAPSTCHTPPSSTWDGGATNQAGSYRFGGGFVIIPFLRLLPSLLSSSSSPCVRLTAEVKPGAWNPRVYGLNVAAPTWCSRPDRGIPVLFSTGGERSPVHSGTLSSPPRRRPRLVPSLSSCHCLMHAAQNRLIASFFVHIHAAPLRWPVVWLLAFALYRWFERYSENASVILNDQPTIHVVRSAGSSWMSA